MKFTERKFYMIIIAVLSLLLFFSWQCRGKKVPCPESVIKPLIITIHDSIDRVPKPVAVIPAKKGQKVSIPQPSLPGTNIQYVPVYIDAPVDTAAILEQFKYLLADYANKKYYEDSLNTKYGKITSKDSVTNNKIFYHKLLADLVIKPPVQKERRFILFGITGGTMQGNSLAAFGANFTYFDRARRGYEIGAMLLTNNKPLYYGGFKIPILK